MNEKKIEFTKSDIKCDCVFPHIKIQEIKNINIVQFDNITRIRIEEAHIIAKNISDDIMFPEFEIFEILQDEEVNATSKLSERNFIYLIEVIKKRQNQSNEADTLLAYVAMGGDQDRGGYVDATKLINIIKNDFEMTIDIEKLIQEIDEDGSGAIEYGEFNTLLNSD